MRYKNQERLWGFSGQIFTHRVYPEYRTESLVNNLRGGKPLFSLVGRATLQIGNVRDFGPNLVFFIPWDHQNEVIEAAYVTPYERWVCPYGVALKKPLPVSYESEAARWLRTVIARRKPFQKNQEILTLQHVRVLEANYFVGLANVRRDILSLGGNINYDPESGIDPELSKVIASAINNSNYDAGQPITNRIPVSA